jgi:cytoskeletal protein CcmA (bactofilin family)
MEAPPNLPKAAMIGKTLIVHGHLSGREDLVIEGRVEGDIELIENRLTVGAGGHIQGGVKAREVVVFGSVNGNLEAAERIEIKKTAKVTGDLKSARFVIEDEAYFKGNIDTVRPDAPKVVAVAPKPQPQPAPPVIPAMEAVNPAQPSLIPGAREIKR